MNKQQILIWLLVAGVLSLIIWQGVALLGGVASTFTPIYCNDYEFSCCTPIVKTYTASLGYSDRMQCPTNAINCEIVSVSGMSVAETNLYRGSVNCRTQSVLGITSFTCDNKKGFFPGQGVSIERGEYVWGKIPLVYPKLTYKVNSQSLTFCGRAGCTIGVPIKSDSCTFNTGDEHNDGKIYNSNGVVLGTSYTVPVSQCVLSWQSGDRHICGNVEEVCSADTDCNGHTYGNYECNARTLQKYGCRQLSLPAGITKDSSGYFGGDSLINSQKNYGTVTKSRCEITSAVTVQCCGDADCGSNMFCDRDTWTCQKTVECAHDYDCGVSTQCDISTLKLKKPVCTSGECEYQIVQSVNCCSDNDCSDGYFCNSKYRCEESVNPKVACPFQCCPAANSEDAKKYFDKPCSPGLNCQTDHTCTSNPPPPPNTCDAECAAMSDWNPMKYLCQFKCYLIGLIEWLKQAAIWVAIGVGFVIIISSVIIGLAIAKKKGRRK